MLRAFLISIGIYLCILGGECLILEKTVMANGAPTAQQQPLGIFSTTPVVKKKEITPSEWAPWSLLSAGAVVMLYGWTMSRQ